MALFLNWLDFASFIIEVGIHSLAGLLPSNQRLRTDNSEAGLGHFAEHEEDLLVPSSAEAEDEVLRSQSPLLLPRNKDQEHFGKGDPLVELGSFVSDYTLGENLEGALAWSYPPH